MTVNEAVSSRLAMLGYTVKEADAPGLAYQISRCEQVILNSTNQNVMPYGLFYVWVDMVAGQFLFDKKNAGELDGEENFDFSAPAKSITEGDVSVTFAGAGDGVNSPEARFDAMLSKLIHPDERILAAYRRMRW